MNNVITAFFAPGVFRIQTEPRYQYNYGQVLAFSGITLPDAYEVHFSNVLLGDSFTQIGDADGVAIPDQLFQTGASIYAWIFLHAADSDGETVYMVTIPVVRRAKPSDLEPTPVEESAITEAIAALQTAVGKTTEQSAAAAASAAEAATSATESAESSLDAEAWAVGQRDGVDVPDTDPTYQNNAKYYADEAGQYIGGLNLENGTGDYSLKQKAPDEYQNIASGNYSIALGMRNTASERQAFASGWNTVASGLRSHTEGEQTTASGRASHAEGSQNVASGEASHAEGIYNEASGSVSHAAGQHTVASGTLSHAEGDGTIANHRAQIAFGTFNIPDSSDSSASERGTYAEIIGNGTADDARSNARTLDWNGNETLAGKLTMGAAPTANMDAATKLYVDDKATEIRGAIPTKTSDLTNDAGYITGLTVLSYGRSTWNDFLEAYTAQKVVYCRASANSDPSTGAQTRLAFLAYVNQESLSSMTEVEFQYYRSVTTHSQTQQGDQVVVYKLHKTNGWSVTVRDAMSKIAVGTGLTMAYSGNTITISPGSTLATTQYADGKASDAQTAAEAYTDTALAAIPAIPKADSLADGAYFLQATVTNGTPAYSWVAVTTWEGGSY